MAKLSTDELLDAFKEMTLIELSEFVKQFEETFGVTAAAPVAVAAAPAAGGAAAYAGWQALGMGRAGVRADAVCAGSGVSAAACARAGCFAGRGGPQRRMADGVHDAHGDVAAGGAAR